MSVTGALQNSPIQRYLEQLYNDLIDIDAGEIASYIPELTRAKPEWLGIALVTVDGHVYQVGESRQTFTIQSVSKAITYGLALEDKGLDHVISKVGVEPSGEAFNSISLEPDTGRPLNPMINAGAIATTGLIGPGPSGDPMARIMDTFLRYTGHPLQIDEKVYQSESDTGHRNRAIAHLLYGHDILDRSPDEVVDLYFRQCSILVSARDLAMIGACLANNGVNPVTGVPALKSRYVEKVLSVMSTCGMYDYSGGWIFNVGMPAKSGVGGGIMAVLPGQFGLGVFSPPLDAKGNSVRGIEACKRISNDFSLHLFNVARSTSSSLVRRIYDCAEFPSRRRRSASEQALLADFGHRIRVYELQGELLFGNAESVSLDMLSAFDEIDYLVVNLRRVVAADRASTKVLVELCVHALTLDKRVFFTECEPLYRFRKSLKALDHAQQSPSWFEFVDTDHAVEWCENKLINQVREDTALYGLSTELSEQYLCTGFDAAELDQLKQYCTEQRFAAGAPIFRAGDHADCLFFIMNGEVEVLVDTEAGVPLRLTTLSAGTTFGEVALVNGRRRTAHVTATCDSACLKVEFDDLPEPLRFKLMLNMASHFAQKIDQDTQLMRHLG